MLSASRSVRVLITALCAPLLPVGVWAQEIYVIAAPGVELTRADVREVYLGDKKFSGAIRLVPVENAAAQGLFLERVIRMDASKYATFWTKKSFRDGLIPPASKASDGEVLLYVKRTPGAVGYVASPPPEDLVRAKF